MWERQSDRDTDDEEEEEEEEGEEGESLLVASPLLLEPSRNGLGAPQWFTHTTTITSIILFFLSLTSIRTRFIAKLLFHTR